MSKKVNWAAVEVDYCAGASLRAIGAKYGISHVTVKNKAEERGWVRGGIPSTEVKKTNVLKLVSGVKPPVKFVNEKLNTPVKEKYAGGCPTKKTEELLDAIFEAIADGKSTRVMCEEVGISKRTFFRWARTDREFGYQYACAKAVRVLERRDATEDDNDVNSWMNLEHDANDVNKKRNQTSIMSARFYFFNQWHMVSYGVVPETSLLTTANHH